MKNNVNRALRAKNNFNLFNRSEAQKNTLCASVNISNASPRDDRDVTETLPRRYGWAKLAATLTLLLTLGVGQMWAIGFNQGNIFFDATGWGTTNYVYFVVGKSDYSSVYQLNTHVANTNLYRAWCTNNGWWNGCTYFGVIGTSGSWGSGSWGSSNLSNAGSYTAAYTSAYDINSGNIYVLQPASSSNGSAFTITYQDGITGLNNTQTLTVQIKVAGAANYSNASTCYGTTISASTNYFNTAWDSADQNGTISLSTTTVTGSASAALSSTVSLSLSGTPTTGYQFDGWYYSDGTRISTATSCSYVAQANKTVYARFSEKTFTVTMANDGHGTTTPASSGTFGQITGGSISASPSTGYNFSTWTLTSGSGSFTSAVTTNSNTFKPTAASTLTASFTPKTYSITLDGNGGSDGSATATYNSSSLSSVTGCSRASYDLQGYYTATSGGTKVINANGTLVASAGSYTNSSSQWIYDDDVELHAQWVYNPVTYSVTYAVGTGYTSYGSLSAANTSTSAAISSGSSVESGTGVTFTASPNAHYKVAGWYSDANCTSAIAGAGTGTTYSTTISANTTVYVKFVLIQTALTLNLHSGSGSTAVTATHGSALPSFTAATRTGYTLQGYYTAESSGTKIINANKSLVASVSGYTDGSSKWIYTGTTLTLHAQWSEVMSTLSTSCHYDAGNPSYAAPSVSGSATTVGYATTRTITATAAGTGYTFAGWTLTNCTRTDGGAATATSITIRSNGDGAAATVVANYNEDLSQSTWIVAGGNKIVTTGTTWRTDADANNSMVKKTGHSTESVVYFTVPVTTVCSGDNNENFQFKIYNTSTSKWYGLSATGDSYYLLKAEDGTEKSLVEDNKNIELRAYVTGDYVLKLDYSTSTPKLTVTWPVYNQVRISAASPSDATNVGNFDLSDPVSNVRSVKRSLNANTTYTFKIVYNSDFYGYNSGTFTRSTSTSSNSRTISTSGGDMTLTTDYAGDYTFKFNQSTKALSVDFPTAYKITFGKGSVDGTTGSFSAVDLDNGNSAVTSNSTWVKSGNRVKITAPDAKSGYRFLGWYDNNSATGDAITTLANCTITVNTTKTVYACYAENLTSVTVSAGTGGTVSTGSGTHSVGVTTGVSINATANTGYSWSTWTTSGNAALGSSASTQSNTAKGNGTNGGTGTITATFTAKSYDVTLDVNGGSGANQTVTATYDAAMPTTLKGGESIAARTKTGYNFSGYAANADGSGTLYYTSALASNHIWDQDVATPSIYAKWTPKQSTLSFDYQASATGYGSGGAVSVGSKATYDAAMPSLTGSMPTAANGYAFMGFYDETGGNGTKYYNANGSSAHNWDKDTESVTTLYAYYKKAEITALTLSQSIVAPNTSGITVTPTINPTPVGTVAVCYEIQYNNGTSLYPQPAHSITDNILTFTAPEASDTYRIQATLNVTNCDGTELHSTYTTFQVAGSHTVTVQYKDADGRTLQASNSVTGLPLDWSEDIIAPDILGYTFARWEPGDGVSIRKGSTEDTVAVSTDATVKIKAVYDGNLTAVYTKKRMIYFNNTLGWDTVCVYFYKNDSYWGVDSNAGRGTGANTGFTFTNTPYGEGLHGGMQRVAQGGNIWYFDAETAGVNASYTNVVFTNKEQHGYEWFYDDVNVIRRTDYNSTQLPMYVPLTGKTPSEMNNNGAHYYFQGYWMNYPENTGYWLKIYDKISGNNPAPKELYSYPFAFTADYTMPMELSIDLEAGQTYGFKIYRADNTYYGNNSTMTANTTNWKMEVDKNNCGLQTTAAGNYTFNLYYNDDNSDSDYQYRVGVTFPVAVNDYRIVYTDNATWSKGAHTASWNHPSRVITKNTNATGTKKDTVSFFWSYSSSPAIKYQTCTAVAAGSATWNAGTSISVSSFSSVLTQAGVYNFIFEQPAGGASISLVKVEPYTGNYYIRTDVAGNTKWSNYQALDHTMTYSDYAAANSGYSHYFAHWVTTGQNIKFTIANDYSPCISDTLVEDYGTTIANINATDPDAGRLNSGNANVRFMWNQSTNKISRAYISGSGNITHRFLVLEGDMKMYDENGHELTGDYQDADEYGTKLGTDYQVILHDDENFVYERTIKVNATARARLSAAYNSNVQYFIGNDTGANWNDKTIQLLGGTYRAEKKYKMRIVYDFKTNRLVTAYLPDGDIDEAMAINADLMLVREHQDPAEQLTFTGDGELSEVKTVYGVMRFNRWTLNNKSTADGHAPLANPKSVYARALYWISFPFDVNLSDVFGFGTYGTHWIIEYYDGAKRAEKGFWKDSETFWTYVMPAERNTFKLEANKGYVLALELDLMKDNDLTFWTNNIENVELYFPSASNVGNIKETNAEVTVTAHQCTIDRTGLNGAGTDINKNRTKADSHWNVIGVPSYANYSSALTDGSSTITWSANPETQDLPFLYEWQETDNKLRAQSGTTYPFKVMHSYMVQYAGTLHWSLASATPQSVAARRQVGYKNNYEFRLEIQCNNEIEDQTFVSLRDNDAVTAAYDFGYDLTKEYNDGANIYTTVENYLPVAGNCLPLETEQVTTVPVGVTIKTAGEYTFAMPDGTEGMNVTLLDSEAGITTDMSVETYQVELPAGTYENRFYMTIDPRNAATQIDIVGGESEDDVRTAKILRNGLLYIQRGDRIYDSTGRKLE